MDVKEAAALLGIHPSTVRRWIRSGKVPATAYREGSAIRYDIPPQWIHTVSMASLGAEAAAATESATETLVPHAAGQANAPDKPGLDRGWQEEIQRGVLKAVDQSVVRALLEAFERFAAEERQRRAELVRETMELKVRLDQVERRLQQVQAALAPERRTGPQAGQPETTVTADVSVTSAPEAAWTEVRKAKAEAAATVSCERASGVSASVHTEPDDGQGQRRRARVRRRAWWRWW